jgi:hypothetical protein
MPPTREPHWYARFSVMDASMRRYVGSVRLCTRVYGAEEHLLSHLPVNLSLPYDACAPVRSSVISEYTSRMLHMSESMDLFQHLNWTSFRVSHNLAL